MNNASHTPTPWKLHDAYKNDAPIVVTPPEGGRPYVAGTLKISHGDTLIASVDFHTSNAGGFPAVDTPQEMKANAELIVRAVNSHAGLVAALTEAINFMEETHNRSLPAIPPEEPTPRDWEVSMFVEKVRVTLAKAKA